MLFSFEMAFTTLNDFKWVWISAAASEFKSPWTSSPSSVGSGRTVHFVFARRRRRLPQWASLPFPSTTVPLSQVFEISKRNQEHCQILLWTLSYISNIFSLMIVHYKITTSGPIGTYMTFASFGYHFTEPTCSSRTPCTLSLMFHWIECQRKNCCPKGTPWQNPHHHVCSTRTSPSPTSTRCFS